jgi:hypothetical protein
MALVLLIHIIPSKNPHSQLLLMAVPRIHIMPLVNMIPSKNPHTLMLLKDISLEDAAEVSKGSTTSMDTSKDI